MYCLANTFLGKIITAATKILYKIDYKYTVSLRKAYLKFETFFWSLYKILTYGTADMFDGIAVETTTYCNRKCLYCPNSVFDRGQKNKERLMPEKLFKKIIEELKEIKFNGRIYPYLYGEPLADDRIVDLMNYVHKKLPQARVIMHTNGDYLDIAMLNKLYYAGVCSYLITLHDGSKESVERIKKLMHYIKSTKKKISILCQVMNDNTALSSRVGLVRIKNVKKDDFQCLSPLCIDYKGDLLLCCHDYLGESNFFGNAEKEKIMEIWLKENFRRVRKQLAKKKFALDICRRCAGYSPSPKIPD